MNANLIRSEGPSVAHSNSLGQSPAPAPTGASADSSAAHLEPAAAQLAEQAPIRIVLAMAAELDRMAWSIVLNNQKDMELVAATSSSRQIVRLLKQHAPDVVLLDEALLDQCHPGALLAFARKSACRFILFAMHQPDYSLEPSRPAFIHARLLKGISAPDLLDTVRTAAANDPTLGMRRRAAQ
jgi:AmiR/NasT family two-component response regulator